MVSFDDTEKLLRKILSEGYFAKIKVSGSSMEPIIHNGDAVLVISLSENTLRVGQIVLFRSNSNTLIAHRITKLINAGGVVKILLKGDSTSRTDFVEKDAVIGEIFGKYLDNKIIRFNTHVFKKIGLCFVKNDLLSKILRKILCRQLDFA